MRPRSTQNPRLQEPPIQRGGFFIGKKVWKGAFAKSRFQESIREARVSETRLPGSFGARFLKSAFETTLKQRFWQQKFTQQSFMEEAMPEKR